MATPNAQAGVYHESEGARFPLTITAAAKELRVTQQRLSRYLKRLQVPVTRLGYSVLIDARGYARVKKALAQQEIRRGRKKKAS